MRKQWIAARLKECGRLQRDVAAAWGIAEGGVSRWLNSDELDDLPLSRAVILADLLELPLTDLAVRLGFAASPPPTARAPEIASKLPMDTLVYCEGPDEAVLFAVHARLAPPGREALREAAAMARLNARAAI